MAARNTAHHLTASFFLLLTSTSQSQTVNSAGWQETFYFVYGYYLSGALKRLIGTCQYLQRMNDHFNLVLNTCFLVFPKTLTSFLLIIKLPETILSPCSQWKDDFKQKQNPHFIPAIAFCSLKWEKKPLPALLKTGAINQRLGPH